MIRENDHSKVLRVLKRMPGVEIGVSDLSLLSEVPLLSVGSRIRSLRTEEYGAYNIVSVRDCVYKLMPGKYETKKAKKKRLEAEKTFYIPFEETLSAPAEKRQ